MEFTTPLTSRVTHVKNPSSNSSTRTIGTGNRPLLSCYNPHTGSDADLAAVAGASLMGTIYAASSTSSSPVSLTAILTAAAPTNQRRR
ncbi:MAG TPA: hypothetical protein VJ841_01110 [Candidatus Saccharimonadales bacterium]|nr:hypothetical protein [Candidatus Saccharimonadales bacterium]